MLDAIRQAIILANKMIMPMNMINARIVLARFEAIILSSVCMLSLPLTLCCQSTSVESLESMTIHLDQTGKTSESDDIFI